MSNSCFHAPLKYNAFAKMSLQFSPICSFHFNNSTPSNYRKLSRFFQLLKILVITCGRDPKRLAIGDKVLEIFVKSTPLICDTDSVTVTFTDRNSGFAFGLLRREIFSRNLIQFDATPQI
ncbi:hypothetical protein QL285_036604 [Trifolium repens]|nr:hypothetical protein QL285_036604 [Trifolium repens]